MDVQPLPEAAEMDAVLRDHPGYGVELNGTEVLAGETVELKTT